MNLLPYNEPFLVSQFREFYTEVIRLKRLINSTGWISSAPSGAKPNGNGSAVETGTWVYYPGFDNAAVPSLLETGSSSLTSRTMLLSVDATLPPLSDQSRRGLLIWQSLLTLFRRNAEAVRGLDRINARSYFEAQYIMAAFADEVFIHLNWEGKQAWTSNLLESTLFQSHVAGEVFFEKLEQLLCERDPANKSLAAVYLMALSLGFRGKYHGANDHGRLSEYRRKLFAFAFSQPSDLMDVSKVAFPDAYVRGLRQETTSKLTNPRLWLAVLGIVFLSYLLVSHGVWLSLTSRLERTNSQIVETENRLNSIPITTR